MIDLILTFYLNYIFGTVLSEKDVLFTNVKEYNDDFPYFSIDHLKYYFLEIYEEKIINKLEKYIKDDQKICSEASKYKEKKAIEDLISYKKTLFLRLILETYDYICAKLVKCTGDGRLFKMTDKFKDLSVKIYNENKEYSSNYSSRDVVDAIGINLKHLTDEYKNSNLNLKHEKQIFIDYNLDIFLYFMEEYNPDVFKNFEKYCRWLRYTNRKTIIYEKLKMEGDEKNVCKNELKNYIKSYINYEKNDEISNINPLDINHILLEIQNVFKEAKANSLVNISFLIDFNYFLFNHTREIFGNGEKIPLIPEAIDRIRQSITAQLKKRFNEEFVTNSKLFQNSSNFSKFIEQRKCKTEPKNLFYFLAAKFISDYKDLTSLIRIELAKTQFIDFIESVQHETVYEELYNITDEFYLKEDYKKQKNAEIESFNVTLLISNFIIPKIGYIILNWLTAHTKYFENIKKYLLVINKEILEMVSDETNNFIADLIWFVKKEGEVIIEKQDKGETTENKQNKSKSKQDDILTDNIKDETDLEKLKQIIQDVFKPKSNKKSSSEKNHTASKGVSKTKSRLNEPETSSHYINEESFNHNNCCNDSQKYKDYLKGSYESSLNDKKYYIEEDDILVNKIEQIFHNIDFEIIQNICILFFKKNLKFKSSTTFFFSRKELKTSLKKNIYLEDEKFLENMNDKSEILYTIYQKELRTFIRKIELVCEEVGRANL